MTQVKDRYSLVIVPVDEARQQLQALIDELAQQYNAPFFSPHITVVSNILADSEELAREKGNAIALAQEVGKFTVSVSEYRFTDEEFRCLFLLAHSPQMDTVYSSAAAIYPQVNDQHFRGLPHLSVMYGTYPTETKEEIIASHPLKPLEFAVESFDLYKTSGPASSWSLI